MFDTAVRYNGGLSHANFFQFEHLMLVLAHGYSFEILAWSRKTFPGRQHEEKEKQTFSSTFWEAALLLDGFLRDMDLRNHTINPVLLAKYQSFIPLPSWCTTDDMTDRQTNRQTIKARGTSRRLRLLSVIKSIQYIISAGMGTMHTLQHADYL